MRIPRWLRWLGLIATLLLIAYLAVGGIVASRLLVPTRATDPDTPATQQLAYEDVTLTSRDGTHLAAWYIPAEGSDRAIFMVHGKDGSRADQYDGRFLELARTLHDAGYAILMMDMRAHGASEGRYFSLGAVEKWDVVAAADWLTAKGFDKIGGIGVSMGGASLAEATLLTDEFDAVVLDSVYPDLEVLLSRELPKRSGLPAWFLPGSLLMARFLTGGDLFHVSPAANTGQVNLPMLLIYGTDDDLIPDEEFDDFDTANPDATTWIVANVGHAGIYAAHTDEYLDRVLPFLDTNVR